MASSCAGDWPPPCSTHSALLWGLGGVHPSHGERGACVRLRKKGNERVMGTLLKSWCNLVHGCGVRVKMMAAGAVWWAFCSQARWGCSFWGSLSRLHLPQLGATGLWHCSVALLSQSMAGMLQWEGAVGAAATLAEGPGANILLSIDMCRERWGKHVWQ